MNSGMSRLDNIMKVSRILLVLASAGTFVILLLRPHLLLLLLTLLLALIAYILVRIDVRRHPIGRDLGATKYETVSIGDFREKKFEKEPIYGSSSSGFLILEKPIKPKGRG